MFFLEITLKEIFEMTFETIGLGYAKNQPNPDCPVGKKINQNLESFWKVSGKKRKVSGNL